MSLDCFSSAADQARAVREGTTTSVALTQAYLDRIERLDSSIGAYLTVDPAGALATAKTVDAAVANGGELGPLAGVPIGLKDLLVTKDLETTAASKILAGWVPPYDGTVVAKLREAGAVIIGKLNMDEFAMGSSNENSSRRLCKNPWDLSRVPGGSSGGSAAAVASAMCATSLGTDTGGSIRQPAALTGTVGLKPTYGRVSRYGVIAFASSLDQIGPITRTVEDAALMLEVIAGFDPRDSTSVDRPVPRFRDSLDRGVKGLTIGLAKEYFQDGTDPEVASSVAAAIETYRRLGAEIKEVSLPHTEYALPCYYLVATAEASSNLARYDGIRYGLRAAHANESLLDTYRESRGAGFGLEVKRRIMLGTYALRSGYYDAYYKKAQQIRTLISNDFARAFESVDVLLSPTSPTPAFKIGERSTNPIDMYLADIFTLSCNLAGLPGISVPCGFTGAGLPIGLQLLGKHMDEETLLAAAAAFEATTSLVGKRPPEITA